MEIKKTFNLKGIKRKPSKMSLNTQFYGKG